MSVAILGNGTFEDLYAPAKGKSEWGMDTLTRKLSGARSLLADYIATLAQGQAYDGYYLQTWEPDENPNVATLTLNYKGLVTGGTPEAKIDTEFVAAAGRTSSDFSEEGDPPGLGRLYRVDTIATAGEPPEPGEFGTSIQFFRNRYAVSAAMEFTYRAAQTRYRYIRVGRPVAPRYSSIGFSYVAPIANVRIILSDGSAYFGRSLENFFDLTPVAVSRVASFIVTPVIGTPWFECEDVIRLELGDAET